MVKENSEKKWLAILVVLMVIVLVVELLSLNVLYQLANNSNLQGQLATLAATSSRPPSDPCERCGYDWSRCVKRCGRKNPTQSCLLSCNADYDSCSYDNC